MPLSYENHQALGSTPPWVWQEAFADLHPSADPLSLGDDEDHDDEQTYRQFMNMGRRPPNERGTGRWKITSTRKTIGIIALDEGVSRRHLEGIRLYMSAFFHGFLVEVVEELDTDVTLCTQEERSFLRHGTNIFQIEQCTIDETVHVEVFSLFDALVSLAKPHHYCLMGLTSKPLAEEWTTTEDGNKDIQHTERMTVLGRACGDRVCAVHVSCFGDERTRTTTTMTTLLATCCHEVLHCMGVDHCTTFRCLMNAQSTENEDCLFLSPLNLKKYVMGVMGIRDSSSSSHGDQCMEFVLERYRRIRIALRTLGYDSSNFSCQWLDEKIKLLQKTPTRKNSKKPTKNNKRKLIRIIRGKQRSGISTGLPG